MPSRSIAAEHMLDRLDFPRGALDRGGAHQIVTCSTADEFRSAAEGRRAENVAVSCGSGFEGQRDGSPECSALPPELVTARASVRCFIGLIAAVSPTPAAECKRGDAGLDRGKAGSYSPLYTTRNPSPETITSHAAANDIRRGQVIKFNGEPHLVMETQHRHAG